MPDVTTTTTAIAIFVLIFFYLTGLLFWSYATLHNQQDTFVYFRSIIFYCLNAFSVPSKQCEIT